MADVTQYIGARYVPIFGRIGEDSIEWDNSKEYEPLTIVSHAGNSYTSRQYVPIGIDISNNAFWALTGNYNAQIEQYRQEVMAFNPRITKAQETADAALNNPRITKAQETADAALNNPRITKAQETADAALNNPRITKAQETADAALNNPRFTIANQTALKSLDATSGSVYVQSFNNIGDNGAGTFVISDTDDATRYSVPMNNGKFALYFCDGEAANLAAMGVVKDSDDVSSAFMNAVEKTAYNEFILPNGTYSVKNTIIISRDYVSIKGTSAPSATSGATGTAKGSVLKWNGDFAVDSAIMLASPKKSYAVDTNFPCRGLIIENLSFDGSNLAGYGFFTPMMAYSGTLNRIYAQACVTAGIVISCAWMVDFGMLDAWYNGIGIIIGKDYTNANGTIFQVKFNYLNGHNSTVQNGASAFTSYRGTGIVFSNAGGSVVNMMDAEKNELQGAILNGYEGLTINAAWFEYNTDSAGNGGTGATTTGLVNIGALALSGKNVIKNTGKLKIDSISSNESYYPFNGSNNNSVLVGNCDWNLSKDQDLTTWNALIVDLKVWARFDALKTTSHNYNNMVVMPKAGINRSIVFIPRQTLEDVETWSIGVGSQSRSVPARSWTSGVPLILNDFVSSGDYKTAEQNYFITTTTKELTVDMLIVSIKYFANGDWQRLTETPNS